MRKYFLIHEKKLVLIIFLLTVVFSLFYSFYFHIQPTVDAKAYDEIGWHIAEGKGYPLDATNRPGPGYEYFLAGIYKIFGHHFEIVLIVQALLLGISAILVFISTRLLIGKEEWHPMFGILPALLIGLSPDLVLSSALLMTETLTVFLTVSALFFYLSYRHNKEILFLALSTLAFSLLALTRGNMILLILLIIFFLLTEKQWKHFFIFTSLVILFLMPWTIRNYSLYAKFMPFNASQGLLYTGNHLGASGELDINFPLPSGYDWEHMSQIEFDAALGREGVKFIKENPRTFIILTMKRLSIYFSAARPFAFWSHLEGGWKIFTILSSSIYAGILFILSGWGGIMGFFSKNFEERKKIMFLIFASLTIPISIAALVVETRYRFGSYPFLALLSGYAVFAFTKQKSEFLKQWKMHVLFFSLIAGNTIFDVGRNIARILGKL